MSKALKSVIDQTYKNWEAIIIDNESVDETYKLINNFNDSRIKYFKISNDGVIAKSRNLGIKEAKGDWVAFLDSDDWWTKDKLEVCFSKITKDVDFIYHAHEYVNKSKSFFKKKIIKGRQLKKPILNDLLIGTITKGSQISNSSVIVRKNILIKIGGLNENKILVGSDDYDTWLRIAQITDQFLYINKKLSFYLVHNANTSSKDMSIPQRLAVRNFMHLFNNQQKLNLEIKLRYISGSYNYLNNNHKKAKKDLMFVIKNGLLHLKLRSLLKLILMVFK
ncbi:glycosyltransferase [Candidatus Pelagibacter ubique]|nr:glycosyltransferase [Candidatus Pelagibacter ubique]